MHQTAEAMDIRGAYSPHSTVSVHRYHLRYVALQCLLSVFQRLSYLAVTNKLLARMLIGFLPGIKAMSERCSRQFKYLE